jgi:hypothetical protein
MYYPDPRIFGQRALDRVFQGERFPKTGILKLKFWKKLD